MRRWRGGGTGEAGGLAVRGYQKNFCTTRHPMGVRTTITDGHPIAVALSGIPLWPDLCSWSMTIHKFRSYEEPQTESGKPGWQCHAGNM